MATTRDNAAMYGDFNEERSMNEILRLLGAVEDHKESKKAENKAYGDLIKEEQESIEFLRGRIDFIRSEAQVEAVLENARDNAA